MVFALSSGLFLCCIWLAAMCVECPKDHCMNLFVVGLSVCLFVCLFVSLGDQTRAFGPTLTWQARTSI